jgi:Domain of unknown function (DUF6457)
MTTAPEHTTDDTLAAWVANLSVELGISPAIVVDIPLLLDLARDAAHGIARPAAPLTTFLVGFAAAMSGGSETAIRSAAATASALATSISRGD